MGLKRTCQSQFESHVSGGKESSLSMFKICSILLPRKSNRSEIRMTKGKDGTSALSLKFKTLLYMTRPWNWLRMQVPATLLGVFFGFYLLNSQIYTSTGEVVSNLSEIINAFVAVACISAGGYVINDYFDKDIDAINEPQRPIPSGVISENLAFIVSIALFGFGLLQSFLIGYLNFVIAGVWVVFAIGYAYRLKRVGYGFESIIFGFMMSLTILYGSIAILHIQDIPYMPILFFTSFMTLYMAAAHITGTLKDIEGDLKAGCKTITILLGKNKIRFLIPFMYSGSFVILLYSAWFDLRFNLLLLLLLIGVAGLVIYSNVNLLSISGKPYVAKALSRSKTYLYAIFLIMAIQFVVVS